MHCTVTIAWELMYVLLSRISEASVDQVIFQNNTMSVQVNIQWNISYLNINCQLSEPAI